MENTIFNIRDFGAVGDGVSDDTTPIREAFAAASACRGTVLVPPGKYITGRQKMTTGMRLTGMASWSCRGMGSSEFLLRDGETDCLIDITGAVGCSIVGMSLTGRFLGENVHGIKLQWAVPNGCGQEDSPTVEDCKICNFTGDGMHYEHVWCCALRRTMLKDNRGAGLYMDGWDAFIDQNWISHNGNCGIFAPGAASSSMTGNRIVWNHKAGVRMGNANGWSISANFFDRSMGPGLDLGGKGKTGSLAITGNYFKRSAKPDVEPFESPYLNSQLWLRGAENVTITGNTFLIGRDDGSRGVLSPEYGIVLCRCAHMAVMGNTMQHGSLRENIITEKCSDMQIGMNVGVPFYTDNPDKDPERNAQQ